MGGAISRTSGNAQQALRQHGQDGADRQTAAAAPATDGPTSPASCRGGAAWGAGATAWVGSSVAGFFVFLALAASTGQGRLNELAFTIWIAAGVAVGMAFHYAFITFPPWFFGLGGQEMSVVFIPVLQIIMFAMGTTLSVADPIDVVEGSVLTVGDGVTLTFSNATGFDANVESSSTLTLESGSTVVADAMRIDGGGLEAAGGQNLGQGLVLVGEPVEAVVAGPVAERAGAGEDRGV